MNKKNLYFLISNTVKEIYFASILINQEIFSINYRKAYTRVIRATG